MNQIKLCNTPQGTNVVDCLLERSKHLYSIFGSKLTAIHLVCIRVHDVSKELLHSNQALQNSGAGKASFQMLEKVFSKIEKILLSIDPKQLSLETPGT